MQHEEKKILSNSFNGDLGLLINKLKDTVFVTLFEMI